MGRTLLPWFLAAAAISCAHAPTGATTVRAGWSYDVTVAPDLARLDVRMRFEGDAPRTLRLGDAAGLPFLAPPVDGAGTALARDRGMFATVSAAAGGEVRYSVDLAGLASAPSARHGAVARRIGRDLRVSAGAWLLRPSPLPPDTGATLRFHLPDGVFAAVPWIADGDDWRLPPSTFEVRGDVAFVHRAPAHFDVEGGRVTVALLDGARKLTEDGAVRAVRDATTAAASLFGGAPAARMLVLFEPVPGSSPCPFGQTKYGGGAAVHLLVGRDARDDALHDDWTPVHEITHVGMPSLESADAWMTEGWVTYYQEVLRARAGMQDAAALWQALSDGFDRGRRSATGRTLGEDSATMDRNHAYLPVYWGGAAAALRLDVELRRSSGGRLSLDDAVRELHRRAATSPEALPARDCLARLDRWLGRPLFVPVGDECLAGRGVPDVSELLRELGVVRGAGGVRLDDDAPLAAVRQAIEGPRTPRAAGR